MTGQTWTDFDSLTTTHTNKWQQLEPQLFSIKTVPSFAINQRALLLRTPQGNVLWDCIANLDPATRALVDALGDQRDRDFAPALLHHHARVGRGI